MDPVLNTRNYLWYSRLKSVGFMLLLLASFSQPIVAQKVKQIHIEKTNRLQGARYNGVDIKKLIGNVILRHDGAYMYCDSAYLFQKENRFIAYSRVRIEQGDSLFLYADSLLYIGNGSYGTAHNNVRLIDNETTLFTDHLDFNFETDIHRYNHGGKIVDSTNVLVSDEGFLYGKLHEYRFLDDVQLTTPDYYCTSDTLSYLSTSKTARFFGPTEIINDTSYLYTELGYYNTQLKFIKLGRKAYYEQKEQSIKADSIFYNQAGGFGSAFDHVWMEDTLQHASIKSNYLYFNEKQEYSFATDSAVFMLNESRDTFYLHADTLYLSRLQDSTKSRLIRAYHEAKFFRYDLQGKCDSLVFTTVDSMISMFREPVLWNEKNQLSADEIKIHLANGTADRIYLNQSSLIVTEQDTVHFNQISGKNMLGFIKDKKLYRIEVDGNAQTIYYPVDGEDIIGVNKAESSNLVIYIQDGTVSRLNFLTKPTGRMLPLDKAGKDDTQLKNFMWLDSQRPRNKYHIFLKERSRL